MLRDSCVYVKEKGPGEASTGETRFCFKPSSTYTAECQDTGDGSIAIDSNIVIDSPESKPSDYTDILMDSPEMKPGSSKSPDSPDLQESPESKKLPESPISQESPVSPDSP